MTGRITFLQIAHRTPEGRPSGGYGFIKDEDGRDRFFNRRDLVGVTFDCLLEGQAVSFDPKERTPMELRDLKAKGKGDNGLLATAVSVTA